MKLPSTEDQQRTFELRCQSKTGHRLHDRDQAFIESMYRQFPEWYGSLSKKVFEATRPFGSNGEL